MAISARTINEIYIANVDNIRASIENYFKTCVDRASQKQVEMELEEEGRVSVTPSLAYFSFSDGWYATSSEFLRKDRIPDFTLQDKGYSFPEKYILEEKPEETLQPGMFRVTKHQDSSDITFLNIEKNPYTISVDTKKEAGRVATLPRIFSTSLERGDGNIVDQFQIKNLLLMKFIINQLEAGTYPSVTPSTAEKIGRQYIKAYYQSLLIELLNKIIFLKYQYVFYDSVVANQFVLSFLPDQEKEKTEEKTEEKKGETKATPSVLTFLQSKYIIQIAGHLIRNLEFLKYLNPDEKLYSSEDTRLAWTEYFVKFMKQYPLKLNFLLEKIDQNQTSATSDKSPSRLVLKNVIAGIRQQRSLPVVNRYGNFSDKELQDEDFLKVVLTNLLFKAKAPSISKQEKYAARDFAIKDIQSISDRKEGQAEGQAEGKHKAPLVVLEAKFKYYMKQPSIFMHRYSSLDSLIGVLRFFLTPYKAQFYSDTQIAVIQAFRMKLEELPKDGEQGEWQKVHDLLYAKEHVDKMKVVLPVTGSPRPRR